MLRGYRRREREERRGRRGEKGEGGELEENLITRHFPLLFIDDVSKQRIAMKVLAEVLTKGQESLGYFYEEYSVGICIWYLHGVPVGVEVALFPRAWYTLSAHVST